MNPQSHQDRAESRGVSRKIAQFLSERLGMAARPIQHAPVGVVLLQAGDSVSRLPFVVSGRVDSVLHLHGDHGGRVIPVSWGEGEVVLLSQLFINRPSFVDLVVGKPAELKWASTAEIEESLLESKDALVLLARFLAHRLREVQTRERGWVERGIHERVCATLSRLAQQAATDAAGHPLIVATHEELAERSGVSRPKLSQELKRLEQQGRLMLERKSIRVIDLQGLFDPGD